MLKDPIPLELVRRVLIIKLRHHGDVLLSSPVFSVLKRHAPHSQIDALIYSDTADMLSLHPAIDQLHLIDRQWKKRGVLGYLAHELALLRALRERRYDLIIHLTDHPRGAWVSRLCRARWAIASKVDGRGRWWKGAFTHFCSIPRAAGRHTVELNLDALRRIGICLSSEEKRVILVAGNEAESRITTLLAELNLETKAFILIHPTSRWLFKCWSADKMAALIDRLQGQSYRVVLSAAPDAAELAMLNSIQTQLKHPVLSVAGRLSLKELAALIARARLFIGVDSAPMHIAAAMGTPTVALFGPSGDKEWGPWEVAHRIVASDSHPCRPCGIDGCGGGKVSDCLTTLPVERVYRAVQELLG